MAEVGTPTWRATSANYVPYSCNDDDKDEFFIEQPSWSELFTYLWTSPIPWELLRNYKHRKFMSVLFIDAIEQFVCQFFIKGF